MKRFRGFLALLVTSVLCASVAAQPIEDLVPADVAVYVRLNFEAEGLPDTSISQLWHEAEVQECLNALSEALENIDDPFSSETGLTLAEWRDVISREIAFAFLEQTADLTGDVPDFALFLRVGPPGSPSARAIDKLTAFLVEDEEPETRTIAGASVTVLGDEDEEWGFARRGDLLILGPIGGLETSLRTPEKPLRLDETFSAFRSEYAPRGDFLVARLNMARLLAMIAEEEDNEGLSSFLELSGLRDDMPFDAVLCPDGKGLKLAALARRSADSELFQRSQSIHLDEKQILRLVPADSTFFLATGVDFRDLYEAIEKMAALSEEEPLEGPSEFAEAVAEFEQETGASIEKDLLAGLGQRIVFLGRQSSASGMPMMPAVSLVIEAADEEAIQRFLEPLIALAQEEGGITLGSMEFRGYTISYLQPEAPVPFSPAYAFAHGNMIVSLSPLALKEYLFFLDEGGPDISSDQDFASARSHLGPADQGMSYARLQQLGMMAYGMLPMIFNFMPADELGGFSSANLPLPGTLEKHLFGSVSVNRAVPEGDLIEVYSPVGLPISGMGAPLAAGMLLPALGREEGGATQCRSNLRQMGLAIIMFTNEHKGRGPEKLSDLVEGGYLTHKGEQVLVCPARKGERLEGEEGYVLRGAVADGSLDWSGNAALGEPIVWDDPSKLWHEDRINVLFGDGSVKTLAADGIPEPPTPGAREWPELVQALRDLYGR